MLENYGINKRNNEELTRDHFLIFLLDQLLTRNPKTLTTKSDGGKLAKMFRWEHWLRGQKFFIGSTVQYPRETRRYN